MPLWTYLTNLIIKPTVVVIKTKYQPVRLKLQHRRPYSLEPSHPAQVLLYCPLFHHDLVYANAAQVLRYGMAGSATPASLDGIADVFPIALFQASAPEVSRNSQPSPREPTKVSTKMGVTAAGLDADDDTAERSVPTPRRINATPCFKCFLQSYNDHGHQCIVMTRSGTGAFTYPRTL